MIFNYCFIFFLSAESMFNGNNFVWIYFHKDLLIDKIMIKTEMPGFNNIWKYKINIVAKEILNLIIHIAKNRWFLNFITHYIPISLLKIFDLQYTVGYIYSGLILFRVISNLTPLIAAEAYLLFPWWKSNPKINTKRSFHH